MILLYTYIRILWMSKYIFRWLELNGFLSVRCCQNFWCFFHFLIVQCLGLLCVKDNLWSRDEARILGFILIVIVLRVLIAIQSKDDDANNQKNNDKNPAVILNPELLLEFSSLVKGGVQRKEWKCKICASADLFYIIKVKITFLLLTPPLLFKLTCSNLELLGSRVQRWELGVSLKDFFNIGPFKNHHVKLKCSHLHALSKSYLKK